MLQLFIWIFTPFQFTFIKITSKPKYIYLKKKYVIVRPFPDTILLKNLELAKKLFKIIGTFLFYSLGRDDPILHIRHE